MLALILFIALMGFSILSRSAGFLRLSIPLLYALIVPYSAFEKKADRALTVISICSSAAISALPSPSCVP